ncbi:MFS transporter, DHA2 family, methylenomycin A resistance protein [Rhizobiales bacterium GAS191]|nr:MFS transporter, DHA2 family, methylenomycin A resistance protein [Rhizobiales bacterium GAS113]SEE12420.1 MFS transporter, DHA2 family, methylenomycin A resistance protein [Rhizobiales bacterium GAS191]
MSHTASQTTDFSNDPSPQKALAQKTGLTLVMLCTGVFMVQLDTTIANMALPAIRADFLAPITGLQWVIDVYVLAFASFLLSAGALGDMIGRKRIFIAGLIGFTFASILCALSPSIEALLMGRMLQGIFASALIPISLAIISTMFAEPRQRARAIGLWAGLGGLALATGPVVGGLLVGLLGWRSIFWLNAPIGFVAAFVLMRLLPQAPTRSTRHLDIRGQLLFVIGVASMTFALIEGNGAGWTSPPILGTLIIAFAALAAFVVCEAQTDQPMLPLAMLRNPVLAVACLVNFAIFFALFTLLFTMTLYLQGIGRLSAFETGLRFLTLTLPIMVASYVASGLAARIGAKVPIVLGASAAMAGLIVLACIPFESGVAVYGWALALIGIGASFAGAPASVAILASVAPERAGTASGIWNTFRQIGAVFAVAVAGMLIGDVATGSTDPAPFVSGMRRALELAAAANGLAALVALTVMPADRPRRLPAGEVAMRG